MGVFRRRLQDRLAYALSEDFAVKMTALRSFRRRFQRDPILTDGPDAAFCDRVCARKIVDKRRSLSDYSDKVVAKQLVADRFGAAVVTPTLWHGTDMAAFARCLRSMTRPYVVKANHGSGWNIFVPDPAATYVDDTVSRCEVWLAQRYGETLGERLYRHIRPQILVEPYLGSTARLPVDYKLFVLRGRAAFVQVDIDRAHAHRRCFYDRDWTWQPFTVRYPLTQEHTPRPRSLDAMIAMAETLARDFDFVRVDFYEIDGQPLFGEMTFYPGSGLEPFAPLAYDLRIGQLWGGFRSTVD